MYVYIYIFGVQEDIFVTRAPGRLDVMGGIADYSGSLVLQVQYMTLLAYHRNLKSWNIFVLLLCFVVLLKASISFT